MKRLLCALCVLRIAAAGGLQDEKVQTVLDRMDKQGPLLLSVSANVEMVEYIALLKSNTEQTGTLQMQRLKKKNVRAILDFTGGDGDARTIGFFGKSLRIYYPKLNAFQDVEVGKNGDLVNQYLLLGFGSTGKELAQSYNIVFLRKENVAGQDTSELQLGPKDAAVRQRLEKVLMWIPDSSANPVQQQFYEPSGNFRKLTYTGIKVNPKIEGTLELHLPPGAKKQS